MEKKKLNEKLIGERVILRRHNESLAQVMFEYVDSDRERLGRFLPWVDHITKVEDESKYIRTINKLWDESTHFDYGIFLNDGTYIGNIGVHNIRWAYNGAELGFWILGKFEGKGYMSEAVSILENHLFDIGFHRVQIRCSDLNSRSEGVPVRCGYTYEGTAREDVIEKGSYRNTKTFSKLLTDNLT